MFFLSRLYTVWGGLDFAIKKHPTIENSDNIYYESSIFTLFSGQSLSVHYQIDKNPEKTTENLLYSPKNCGI